MFSGQRFTFALLEIKVKSGKEKMCNKQNEGEFMTSLARISQIIIKKRTEMKKKKNKKTFDN